MNKNILKKMLTFSLFVFLIIPTVFSQSIIETDFDRPIIPPSNPTSDNTCDGANTGLHGGFFQKLVDYPNDIDWYRGYVSGTQEIRVIMSVPPEENYDIKIYDTCSDGNPLDYKWICNAGTGTQEDFYCKTTVTGYYYVKVYGVNSNDYSSTNQYVIYSGLSNQCSTSIDWGYPTKIPFECNDEIRVNSLGYYNFQSDTYAYHVLHKLFKPSGDKVSSFEIWSQYLSPTSWVWRNVIHNPPSGKWPEFGTYNLRAIVTGWCSNGGIDIVTNRPDSQPVVSNLHSYYGCQNNDVWSFNACDAPRELYQDCGNDGWGSPGSKYCINEDAYQDVPFYDRGCSSGSCFSNISYYDTQLVENCNNNNYYGSFEYYCSGDYRKKHQKYYDYGCSSGNCYLQSSNYVNDQTDIYCPTQNYYDAFVDYCYQDDLWKKQLYHEFGCVGTGCTETNTYYVNNQLKSPCDYGCNINTNQCNPAPTYPDLEVTVNDIWFEKVIA